MRQEIIEGLVKALQKASLDGALKEEAVDYVNSLIAENKTLKADKNSLEKQLETVKKEKESTYEVLTKANVELQEYRNRETELCEREDKILELELTAQYERERVMDHKEMFSQVFRNIEVRRGVFNVVPGHPGDQYSSATQGYVTQDTQVEESK